MFRACRHGFVVGLRSRRTDAKRGAGPTTSSPRYEASRPEDTQSKNSALVAEERNTPEHREDAVFHSVGRPIGSTEYGVCSANPNFCALCEPLSAEKFCVSLLPSHQRTNTNITQGRYHTQPRVRIMRLLLACRAGFTKNGIPVLVNLPRKPGEGGLVEWLVAREPDWCRVPRPSSLETSPTTREVAFLAPGWLRQILAFWKRSGAQRPCVGPLAAERQPIQRPKARPRTAQTTDWLAERASPRPEPR